ncbi:MAG: D-alanyl-D-alanine carboxypeptidase/D-alanyl-D-alanine-endopeptidase [Bacteroidia bacterium]|nr:D-alanyl-D-alanine carboxypeptidase/D-alanyl-D-alanine-endopeptidase [Bacteroidia bacterium]
MKHIRLKPHCLLALVPLLWCFAPPASKLQTEINSLNADADLKTGSWTLYAITADSGKVIAEVNAGKVHTPASTLKIFTTAAAISMLGADFRYETVLEHTGSFDTASGKVNGNLCIKGSGDPTLDSKHFRKEADSTQLQRWAAALYKKGVRHITGAVVADVSAFGDNPLPDGWTWGDMGQYYGAPSSALCWHDNSYSLFFTSTADTVRLTRTTPVPEGLRIVADLKTGGTKDDAYVYGAPYGNLHSIRGRIPANAKDFEVEAALPDPALQCAIEFTRALQAQGITVNAAPYTQNRASKEERKKLHATFSPRLSEIVYRTNLKSDNVYAEQLLRTISLIKNTTGNIGATTENGAALVTQFWKQQGVDTKGMYMTDGSGLSRSNAVTATQQAQALRIISRWPKKQYDAFRNSLPVAGKSGSLAGLCKGSLAENNLTAKSGYITRARGYAGYVTTTKGKLICFSLLANNYTCTPTEMKKKLEKIMIALAEL